MFPCCPMLSLSHAGAVIQGAGAFSYVFSTVAFIQRGRETVELVQLARQATRMERGRAVVCRRGDLTFELVFTWPVHFLSKDM